MVGYLETSFFFFFFVAIPTPERANVWMAQWRLCTMHHIGFLLINILYGLQHMLSRVWGCRCRCAHIG